MDVTKVYEFASLFHIASLFMKPLSQELAKSVAQQIIKMIPSAVFYTEEDAENLEDREEKSFWDIHTDFVRVLYSEYTSTGGAGVIVFPPNNEPFTLSHLEEVPSFIEKVRSIGTESQFPHID
jgi:hypothetical protein